MKNTCRLQRQRGVAVITALLLTTLAVTIVASLFWQQQVQVRSIENQRTQLQKQWILRGALDWSRLILRSDTNQVDYLGDPWAIPLEEVRLDEFVENGKQDADASSAMLSGYIVDAQSRLNVNALVRNGGALSPPDVTAFAKLLNSLRIPSANALTNATVSYLLTARQPQTTVVPTSGSTTTTPGSTTSTNNTSQSQAVAHMMPLTQLDDLLAIPGFTEETLLKLKDYVIVLPFSDSKINVNTATAEVLSAVIPGLGLSDAATLVASRERAYFKDAADFTNRLPATNAARATSAVSLDVKTEYFLVNGKVKLNNAVLEIQSLVQRRGSVVTVLWTRET
ncbi:type II secretion system minor pseudopilin GspK [Actimicrobium sp. CCC2.4]|uniref:type II secretion system minor pseudopilin GspK n=1 Tax=Actimicrobium sp. CCC2.4 TaxID=3048606 RepID=UPI002AC948F1|nr:type II secretion system minor pseudopilin GspK [Actimicrobium sp. CCC2.4]MEB0134199.1 type II secretion system minor pseudopilin GspK [Actimicrobium sp. CCC2.4]WPX32852.1 type II secretion system minor pseudopilin GspK [Actimicrobium sp. CCC2.4]